MARKQWIKVLDNKEDLAEGRVMTVTANHHDYCLARHQGKFCALENKCPHQGGPLGEGSIENGLLRCPWHGWDFDPCTGKVPMYDDGVESFPTKVQKGAVYIQVQKEQPTPRTISDAMVETMTNWGVDTVFGMVGHSNLGLADAMRKAEEAGKLQYYGIRHEGAASFAASAYGKLTGRPAACFAIAGPGATNLYTGMWDAKVDRAPLLALTGQVATQVLGTENFQELDLVRAFQTVADFNHRVQVKSRHTELMSLAIKHATLKRDVSHLTFPDEIQVLPDHRGRAGSPAQRMPDLQITPAPQAFAAAVDLIRASRQPLIIVGHGARFHMEAITALAEHLNAAVITTFKGKGLISDDHPLAGGVLGRSGTPIASWLMNESNLLLVLGASFSKHTGITPKKPTIQVDFDQMALAKHHRIDIPLWGEISITVERLKSALADHAGEHDQRPLIRARWKLWRAEKKKRLKETRRKGVPSITVFDALNRFAPHDAVMCVDVGNNAYAFGRYFESRKHSFLMSGYLGSIGFALPASIGAWTAVKGQRPVVAVAGDGGLAQYLAEITTLVKYQMDVKLIIMNNFELGKISKEQRASDYPVWKTSLTNPDFAAFARSCGAVGLQAKSKRAVYEQMKALFNHHGPAVLEILTDPALL